MDKQEMAQLMEMMEQMLAKMKAKREANHKEMMAWLKDLKFNREETTVCHEASEAGEGTMACQETTEARLEGKERPASEEMKVAHQEILREDAVVMPVGNRGKGVGTNDEIWPRCAARRRNRTKTWARGVAGRDRSGPRGKMGAERAWSLPAEGRPAVQQWHGARGTF
jgi:hypothetical protein